jgi:hypothetical protein
MNYLFWFVLPFALWLMFWIIVDFMTKNWGSSELEDIVNCKWGKDNDY